MRKEQTLFNKAFGGINKMTNTTSYGFQVNNTGGYYLYDRKTYKPLPEGHKHFMETSDLEIIKKHLKKIHDDSKKV